MSDLSATIELSEDWMPEELTMGPLTEELKDKDSPVRQFLDRRFTGGLREVQQRYRTAAPALVVPGVPQVAANPGTVGTAADWLLRFVLHPRPSLRLASLGAMLCGRQAGLTGVLVDIAASLGKGYDAFEATDSDDFVGPVAGARTAPEHLACVCWFLALLTEAYRGGPAVAMAGPLGRFRNRQPSVDEVLHMAPKAAIGQLSDLRHVFEAVLVTQLATRRGPWSLGPEFTGSALLKADADLIAAGLLIDLKTTSAKPSLGVQEAFQVIGYALLDFDDAYQLTEVGIFSARYAYLSIWHIDQLLDDLAGHLVSLSSTRQEFRRLLLTDR
jgi:hypothetical protein